MNASRVLFNTVMDRRTFLLELFIAVGSMVCGIMLLIPPIQEFYRTTVIGIIPPLVLGLIFLVHGMTSFTVLEKRDLAACFRAAKNGMRLWSYPSMCFLISPPAHYALTITVTSVVMTVFAGWVALRLELKLVKG